MSITSTKRRASATLEGQGVSGWTRQISFSRTWYVNETLSAGLELNYTQSDDWLVWTGGDALARYRRNELSTLLNVNWFPVARHELRFKLQWVGLGATLKNSYRIGGDGSLDDRREGLASQFNRAWSQKTADQLFVKLRYRFK